MESDAPNAEPNAAAGGEGRRDPWSSTTSIPVVAPADLDRTGYFKPLSPGGRIERAWAGAGLLLGRRLAMVVRDDHIFVILMAAVVGATSGAAAGLLMAWIDFAVASFPEPTRSDEIVRWVFVLGVPVLGGLLAGGLRLLARRLIRQPPVLGVPAVIEAVAKRAGVLHGRSGLVCGLGTGLTIGSGGSTGHEGPSVAIGATVGSVLARFFGLGRRRRVAMVGAGSAAGIAAAFNAPLGGVIFTVEIVFGGAIGGDVGAMSVFIPLIVAAVCGTFVSHAIRGENLSFIDLPAHAGLSLGELAFYVLLALAAGVIGPLFARTVVRMGHSFEKVKAPVWVKPAIGALGVGLLAAVVSHDLLGAGHSTVDRALHGELGWRWAAILLLLKIVATGLTVGSGGFGGTFLPQMYVGACLGTLVGTLATLVVGGSQDVGAYALVGMGAIFGAVMHAPLTPIVMVFELTRDYGIILPLMLSCILAVVVARRISPQSLLALELADRGVVLDHEAERDVMRRGHVRELMLPPPPVLTSGAGLDEIRKAALDAELHAVFVVDADGGVIGYINGKTLAQQVLLSKVHEASTAADLMVTRRLPLLYCDDTLAGAMVASARSGLEILPVVDESRRLIGALRRGDLIAHYSEHVLHEREEVVQVRTNAAVPDQEVGLGRGIILERVIVGRRWAGRSLAELELRQRTGTTVLEWCRGEDTLPVDPRAPLREGDLLAIAGTREQILRARTL